MPSPNHSGKGKIGGEQRIGIGADGIEGDIAEIEQASEADDDVEAPAQHDVGEHQDGEIDDAPVDARNEGQDDRQNRRTGAMYLPKFMAGARRAPWQPSMAWPRGLFHTSKWMAQAARGDDGDKHATMPQRYSSARPPCGECLEADEWGRGWRRRSGR